MRFKKRETPLTDKEVDAFTESLMEVSEYDHAFINEIGEAYRKFDISKQDVANIHFAIPTEIISLFYKVEFEDPNFVLNCDYNQTQIQIIHQSLSDDITLEWIEKHLPATVPYRKMEWVLVAISNGHSYFKDNIDTLVKDYDHDQLYELYAGAESKIDFIVYANPKIDARLMRAMRYCMEQGLEVRVNADLDSFSARV